MPAVCPHNHPQLTHPRLIIVKFFSGWVATLVVSGLTAAAFMAQVGGDAEKGFDA